MPESKLAEFVSQYHCRMSGLFMAHQESLLSQDLDLAKLFLRAYCQYIQAHIEAENALLLPYLSEAGLTFRWGLELYSKEHEKILRMLAEVVHMLDAVPAGMGSAQRRSLLKLIDYERVFKNVVEHHEEREEGALLIELDKQLSPETLNRLVNACAEAWQTLPDLTAEIDLLASH